MAKRSAGRNKMARQERGRQQKQKKPIKYRKPLNLNIGMILFGAIFVYVVYCVISYIQSDPIRPYEVQEGSLSTNTTYKAVALRSETVVTTDTAGYMNYYLREGERVRKGSMVCTVDETGKLNEYMENLNLGESKLSNEELNDFRNEIVNFMHSFDAQNFSLAYDFKYSIEGTVLRLANSNMLEYLNQMDSSGVIKTCTAPETGIVAYWTDGYETLTADQVTADVFNEENYTKNQLVGTELAAVGDPAYKLSTDENWCVVFPVDEETGQALSEKGYIKVRFLKNQYESWGAVTLLHNSDGAYIKLSFTNSMLTYVSERFLEIELILSDQTGLKIPLSAIAERTFFLIPEDFVIQEGDNGESGVMRQTYLEDGTLSSEFVEASIYSFDEDTGQYYLDTSVLEMGNILLKLDSQETYTVSSQASLIGVYNMNKGYADFREINILAQNAEYALVQPNTKYGLNVYDNIVLDAASVKADQFIYQ